VQHPAEDDLALVALGERLPAVSAHAADCPGCAAELLALASTVRTARGADLGALPPPPGAVWDRVSSELGLGAVPVPQPPRTARRAVLVLLAVAAAALGVLVVRGLPGDATGTRLVALGGSSGTGEAVLRTEQAGRVLQVDTRGLAAPDGFYEVWLLDPGSSRILALGTLDERGGAELSVPESVDLADYAVVDVSAEPDDGDPAHSSDSVLRGDLPR
jgi:hypothetical protein